MTVKSVLSSKQLQRDTRHPFTKFNDWMKKKDALFFIGVVFASSFFLYQFAVLIYFITIFLILLTFQKFKLPIHLPIFAKYKKDYNNLKTVKIKGKNTPVPSAPAGVVYVGNMQSTNEQVWWDKPLTCTHVFFLATTGGGKTFSFAGILANFVIYSGFCYSDAKADLGLVETYSRMMFRMGRINQLFILSFQSGNRSPWSIAKGERISHSFNPAASGSAPMIAELFKSLLDGDGDIWAKRGDNLSTVLIRPLTYMRDVFSWPMGFGQIAKHFTIEKLGMLCGVAENRNSAYPIQKEHFSYFDPLISFIKTLPGLTENDYEGLASGNKELISKITPSTRDQLGFVTMQLVNITNDLVGDYGHVFETMYGQINLEDALTNRKVVITLLPALERSESTMSILGRITLAAQKTIVANAQSFKLFGELSDHIGSRPTAADCPFASVNDEAGSYMVDGVSANTAMARSANVSFLFGGQDLQAMKKRGGMIEKEVDTIWGTTVNKMAGSVLEESTINAFIQAADEEYRLEATDFEIEDNGYYKKKKSNRFSVQQRKLLTPTMLSNQEAGQVQLLTRGTVRSISLPNFVTAGLKKPVTNFYITETIPIIPMDHEFLVMRKGITSRVKVAIDVSANANVFELAMDDISEARLKSVGINMTLNFFEQMMQRFKNPAYRTLTLFSAQCLVQYFISEYCQKTLRHLKVNVNTPDESKLREAHGRGLEVLFNATVIAAPAALIQTADDTIEDDEDYDDNVDSLTDDEFKAAANASAFDEVNIEAFQRELSNITGDDDGDNEDESADTIINNMLSGLEKAEVTNANKDPFINTYADETDGDDSDDAGALTSNVVVGESPELNLKLHYSSLVDIAELLADSGVTTTEPTLPMDDKEVNKEEVVEQVDYDIAALDAIRSYRPSAYEPSKDAIVDAIASLIDSLNTDNA